MSTTTFDNLALVANAIDLSVEIVANVAGNQISSYMDGAPLNDRTIAAIAAADINNVIEGRDNA
jgi:hypothetical protein